MRGIFLLIWILIGWFGLPAVALDDAQTDIVKTTNNTQYNQQPTLELANAEDQEKCITIMAAFPDSGHAARYHFFRLVEAISVDSSDDFRSTLTAYRGDHIPPETPITEVVEGIANPVLRQAVPQLAVAQTAHLIDFAHTCDSFIRGQIQSLEAYDPTLIETETNRVILEDALFLRQVLADALFRLDANTDAVHGPQLIAYSRSLLSARNDLEFQSFEKDVDEIEAIFLSDLDGRLARSNDIINGELSKEALESAISLSEDLNEGARQRHEQRMRLLVRSILVGSL